MSDAAEGRSASERGSESSDSSPTPTNQNSYLSGNASYTPSTPSPGPQDSYLSGNASYGIAPASEKNYSADTSALGNYYDAHKEADPDSKMPTVGMYDKERNWFGKAYDKLKSQGAAGALFFPGTYIAGAVADKFGLLDSQIGTGSLADVQEADTAAKNNVATSTRGGSSGTSDIWGGVAQQPTRPTIAATAPQVSKGPLLADWFKSNPNASDIRIRQAQDKNGWSADDVAAAMKTTSSMWGARYNAATPYFHFSGMVDDLLADQMADNPSSGLTSFMLGNRTPGRA